MTTGPAARPFAWVRSQAAAGTSMRDCWNPLLVEAWRENNAAARAALDGLTLAHIVDFVLRNDPGLHAMPASGVLAHWADSAPGTYADLLTQCGAGPVGSPSDPLVAGSDAGSLEPQAAGRDATGWLRRLWSLAADRGLDFLELLVEASRSPNMVTLVAANPTKQNPYERAAAAYLGQRCARAGSQVRAVVRLAEHGIGIRFRSDGTSFLSQRQDRASKSADFAILVSDGGRRARWHICAHKYARVAGGHQDNQREDALAFVEYAGRCPNPRGVLDALGDLRSAHAPRATDVSWRAGLILDGPFFAASLPSIAGRYASTAFVGDTDGWATWLTTPSAL